MSRLTVTTKHIRTIPGFSSNSGFCVSKSREWAMRHGIDFKAFLRNGIDAETLLATGDGFALALVEWARQCEEVQSRG